ncbi:hypothetical protein AOLI_G00142060 [Acnodon oligacanthus]
MKSYPHGAGLPGVGPDCLRPQLGLGSDGSPPPAPKTLPQAITQRSAPLPPIYIRLHDEARCPERPAAPSGKHKPSRPPAPPPRRRYGPLVGTVIRVRADHERRLQPSGGRICVTGSPSDRFSARANRFDPRPWR